MAAARCAREPAPGPVIVVQVAPVVGIGGGASGVGAPTGQSLGGTDGDPCPNACPIQRLRLLLRENTQGVCQNAALPILGGVEFCKRWHMGLSCFREFPKKGSHVQPSVAVVEKFAQAMTRARVIEVG